MNSKKSNDLILLLSTDWNLTGLSDKQNNNYFYQENQIVNEGNGKNVLSITRYRSKGAWDRLQCWDFSVTYPEAPETLMQISKHYNKKDFVFWIGIALLETTSYFCIKHLISSKRITNEGSCGIIIYWLQVKIVLKISIR